MKASILSTATLLMLGLGGLSPQVARSENITCVRESNIITCPGYGSFQYTTNNVNNRYIRGPEINNLFLQVLGRNATNNELRDFNQTVSNRGWSLRQIRENLVNSQDFYQSINGYYREFLGRNIDDNGLTSYRNVVLGGRNLGDIRNEISNSTEARNRNSNNRNYNQVTYNSEQQRQFNDLYVQVLGRNANANDVRDYNRLTNNKQNYSLVEVRRDLANSQQFKEAMNGLYQEYLGRNADSAGLQGYRNAVITGRTFENIKYEISNSPEAQRYDDNDDDDSRNQSTGNSMMKGILCGITNVCF